MPHLRVRALITSAVVAAAALVAVSAPATAVAEPHFTGYAEVSSYEDLARELSYVSSSYSMQIVLEAPISDSGHTLTVPAGGAASIDLHGHDLDLVGSAPGAWGSISVGAGGSLSLDESWGNGATLTAVGRPATDASAGSGAGIQITDATLRIQGDLHVVATGGVAGHEGGGTVGSGAAIGGDGGASGAPGGAGGAVTMLYHAVVTATGGAAGDPDGDNSAGAGAGIGAGGSGAGAPGSTGGSFWLCNWAAVVATGGSARAGDGANTGGGGAGVGGGGAGGSTDGAAGGTGASAKLTESASLTATGGDALGASGNEGGGGAALGGGGGGNGDGGAGGELVAVTNVPTPVLTSATSATLSHDGRDSTITPVDAVTVTSITPDSGSTTQVEPVTITGSGFVAGATTVSMNGVLATGVTVLSPTTLTAVTPDFTATAEGATDVEVAVQHDQYGFAVWGFLSDGFYFGYAPDASDNNGIVAQDSTDNPYRLLYSDMSTTGGGTALSLVSGPEHGSARVSGKYLLYTPDPGYTGEDSAVFRASNRWGSDEATVFMTVDPVTTPTIASVSPAMDGTGGGRQVVITGSGFESGRTTVSFGATPAWKVVVNSATTLTATTPAVADPGIVDVTVTTTNWTWNIERSATLVDAFTYGIKPTASNASATTANHTPVTIPLQYTGEQATVRPNGGGAGGTVTISGRSLVYTPVPGFSGTTRIGYIVENPYGLATGEVTVTVMPALTDSATLSVSGTKVVGHRQVLTGTSSPALPGTFTFSDGTKVLGTAVTTSGRGSLAIALGAGTHHVTASFTAADPQYRVSTSAASVVAVAKATPRISTKLSPTKVVAGSTRAKLLVTVSAPYASVTGKVTVTANGKSTTLTLSGGRATFTLPMFGVAKKYPVSVHYLGSFSVASSTLKSSVSVVRR